MPDWAIWAVLAVLLAAGELATTGLFFLGPVALAAGAAVIVAAAGAGLVAQLIAFVVGSALGLLVLRPLARRYLRVPPALRTGVAALPGARATVLQLVDEHGGTINVGGAVWTARPYVQGAAIEPGAAVEVVKIEGATALVME